MKSKTKILLLMVLLGIVTPQIAYAAGGNDEEEEEHPVHNTKSTRTIDFDAFEKKPLTYKTGIWINNIGKIDAASGSYELDFWYFLSSEDVNFLEVGIPPPAFVNAKSTTFDSEFMGEHYYEVRVRGKFFHTLDFKDYPFERLKLRVEIEPDLPYHIKNAVFYVDETLSGVDKKVNVVGWQLQKPTFTVLQHDYQGFYSFSRFAADIPIERSPIGAILKTFLPVSVIVGISLLVFIIPENFTPRIYLTAPLLLALVYLHRGSLSELPTLSYMTVFDKTMVIFYAIFTNSILSLAMQMRLHALKKTEITAKVNKMMLLLIPAIVAILAVLLSFV